MLLDQLHDDQDRPIVAMLLEGVGVDDIAATLGLSRAAVKARLARLPAVAMAVAGDAAPNRRWARVALTSTGCHVGRT